MTLCIAAACQEFFKDRIVIGFDRKISSDIWSSETEFKMEELIPRQLLALFAGTVSEARELLLIYRHEVSSLPARAEMLEKLREPLRIHKRRKVESLVARRLGLTYDQFLDRGDQIEETMRSQIFTAIDGLSIDVDLLIAGFYIDKTLNNALRSQIFQVQQEDVEVHHNFACIGAGAASAEFTLHRREQDAALELDATVYNVYEAMKLAQIAPSVGKDIHIVTLEPVEEGGGEYTLQLLTREGTNVLSEYYERFGPKIAKDVDIPKEAFIKI